MVLSDYIIYADGNWMSNDIFGDMVVDNESGGRFLFGGHFIGA